VTRAMAKGMVIVIAIMAIRTQLAEHMGPIWVAAGPSGLNYGQITWGPSGEDGPHFTQVSSIWFLHR
jgi:hypothetical protein